MPQGWWSIYYTGLARCNTTILGCQNAVESVKEEDVKRLEAEAHTLRAYYVHNLWKMWGNIPYFDSDIPAPYFAKQYTADEIYTFIMADLDYALDGDKLPKQATVSTMGRITKPVAQMLRARVAMYQNDESRYNEILSDMVEITVNPSFGFMDNLEDVFVAAGEFCIESIFETNQQADGKTWANSWSGFGTNLPAFISPADFSGEGFEREGWGFGPLREETYTMYSPDDKRRDASIQNAKKFSYTPRFQDSGFFNKKYAARKGYNDVKSGDAPLNYDNNLRIFRLPEAYLNAAELIVKGATAPGAQSAQYYLDAVRARAFGDKFEQNKVTATLDNIKQERRLEFLGEGLRYWDLVRWGDAATVLTENKPEKFSIRTWNASKKYLPIPQSEIDKTKGMGEFELKQNP